MPNSQFVERAGMLLEMLGMPRMTGRVLGALLQAPATGHTPAELAGQLQVSRAAISGALQHLKLMGLSENVPNPGERAGRYRARPGAWAALTEQGNRKLQTLHGLADEGLQTLPEGADPIALEEMRDFYALWLELFPVMLREWQERRP